MVFLFLLILCFFPFIAAVYSFFVLGSASFRPFDKLVSTCLFDDHSNFDLAAPEWCKFPLGRQVCSYFFLPQIHQQQVMRQGLKDELGLVVRAKESIIRALAIEHEDLRSIKNKFEAVIGQV